MTGLQEHIRHSRKIRCAIFICDAERLLAQQTVQRESFQEGTYVKFEGWNQHEGRITLTQGRDTKGRSQGRS